MNSQSSSQPSTAGVEEASDEAPQVADLIVDYLAQLGIEYVFGIPGGAIEPLYNAMARSARRGGPRPMVARHEAGAAFMADGYSRETGRIGVCCATSGPGATNLITGVACAFDNGIPMLVITGQPSLPSFGKRALQESACTGINTLGMFRHCTRYNSLVSHPEQIESKLITALQRAMRAPRGPVHLSIPRDILKSPSPVRHASYNITDKLRPTSLLDAEATDELLEHLQHAGQVRLLIGGSCGEAIGSILQFATLHNIPVVTTPDGKGLVSPYHPLFCGVFGFAGHHTAGALLGNPDVDLLLAVGTSMNEWTSSGWSDTLLNHKLVHIDESAEHLARSPMARLHVRGRLLSIFDRLIERTHKMREKSSFKLPRRRDASPLPLPEWSTGEMLAEPDKRLSPAKPIKPQRLMHELSQLFPPNTRFLADAGNSVAWAIHYLAPADRRFGERRLSLGTRRRDNGRRQSAGGWLRLTMDFAPMGWAIGGAIGTAASNPQSPVVCITGDGSLMMNGQEISVAVAEGLTVIFVILNDQALGMVKHGQRLAGAERIGFQLPSTDFAAMARAMGADGYTVRSPEDMAALDIEAICSKKGPTLLDVFIDGEEVPPMNLRMQVLGTDIPATPMLPPLLPD
jgi:acetolactate synthase I/II/III large subunit